MLTLDFSDKVLKLKQICTCQICNQYFNNPMLLKCGHSTCRSCLKKRKFCYTCNKRTKISSQVNNVMVQLTDKVKRIEELFLDNKISDFQLTVDKQFAISNIKKITDNDITVSKQLTPPSITTQTTETVVDSSPNMEQYVNDDFIRWMVKQKFEIITKFTKRNAKGETPLHTACRSGKVEQVINLIQTGADVNAVDYANWTPLHEAVQKGFTKCCEIVLEAGALPNVPGGGYATPLHLTSDLNLSKLLIKYGADINEHDYNGDSVIDLCENNSIKKELWLTKTEKDCTKYFIRPREVFLLSKISEQFEALFQSQEFTKCDISVKQDSIGLAFDGNPYGVDVMHAILLGKILVKGNDLQTDSVFSLLPLDIRKAYFKSIVHRLRRNPKLFNGISFHVSGHETPVRINGVEFTKKDLNDLILDGGGTLLFRPPAERTVNKLKAYPFHARLNPKMRICCNVIVYEENNEPLLMYNMAELRHLSSKWLIDCIVQFKIV